MAKWRRLASLLLGVCCLSGATANVQADTNPPPLLVAGISTNGNLTGTGDSDAYQVEVGAGQRLVVQLDGDDYRDRNALYVRYGALPSATNYDVAAVVDQADQYLEVTNARAGAYYILVRCTYNYSGGLTYTLRADTDATLPTLALGTPTGGELLQAEDFDLYRLEIGAGQHLVLHLNSESFADDNELYVRYGALPSTTQYDAAGKQPDRADQYLELTNTQAGTYYVLVRCAVDAGWATAYQLRADTLTTLPALTLGTSTTGTLPNTYDFDFYRVDMVAGRLLALRCAGSDASDYNEVYVRYSALPTPEEYDAAGKVADQSSQYLEINGTRAGTYYVLVRCAYDASSEDEYTIGVEVGPMVPRFLVNKRIGTRLEDVQLSYQEALTHLETLGASITNYPDLSSLVPGDVGALFLPTPDSPYSDTEVQAIAAFYHAGGALLILDDWGNAPDAWNEATDQLLGIVGLEDGGNPSGGTPIDANVVLAHPVTDGPGGTVAAVGLNGQGYDYFVNLPMYAQALATDAQSRPVLVVIPRGGQGAGYGAVAAIGDANCFEDDGTRPWRQNRALWENLWAWLCGQGGLILSPVRSGAVLANDSLRFAAEGEASRFLWSFGDGRSSTMQNPGLVSFPVAGTNIVTLSTTDSGGASNTVVASRTFTVVAATNLVPDLAVTHLNVPAQLAIGQPAQITYTVRNVGDAAASGTSWKDALYLSHDQYLDVNDHLLVASSVSNIVPVNGSYTNTLTVTIPAVEEGAYYLLLSVDDEWQVLERHQLNNELAVATELAIPRLTNAAPFTASLRGNGDEQYFRIDVPAGQNLLIRLDDADNQGANELYVRFGALPTRGTFDLRAATPGAADQQLLIPAAAPGTYYIMVRGQSVPGNGQFTLQATTASLEVTSVTPSRYGQSASAVLTVTGAGFDATAAAELVASGGAACPATSASADSFTQLTATFNLSSLPVGTYSLRVSSPLWGTSTLANAFEVLPAGEARLETSLAVPSQLGYHATATVWVEYRNTGNAAMPAPLLVLTAVQEHKQPGYLREGAYLTLQDHRLVEGFWTSAEPEGFSHSVQILASGDTPGVLQPGDSIRVPVYYAGWEQPWDFSYPPINWNLGVLRADDKNVVNWAALRTNMQPVSMNTEAWEVLWTGFTSQVGSTWGDYVRMLNDNAAYLGRLGQRVVDVGQLLAFECLQADGLSPLRTLASAVDAAVEAPGLPLVFSRSFPGSISQRFETGPLGRGWSHNWQYSLSVAGDGTVTVLGPGGSRRTFQPDSRNSNNYFAQAGDHTTLTPLGGRVFLLREPAGLQRVFRPDGGLDYVQDPNGNRITCGYSGNLLTSLTHSSGQGLAIGYSAGGQIRSITDQLGRQTVLNYEGSGEHLLNAQYYDGRTATYEYQSLLTSATTHALISVANSCCARRYFGYDAQGRLRSTYRDGGTYAVTFTYDDAGKVTTTDALGGASKFYFDHRGLLLKTEDALGNAVHLAFDDNYNLVRLTDPAGRSYGYAYDGNGNLTQSTDPLGHASLFTYHASLNRLASVTDANGNITHYAYTGAGNLQAITYTDGSQEGWAYDALGNATTWTNRRGRGINYAYNANGQLTSKVFADGSRAVYAYDPRGNLTNATTLDSGLGTLDFSVMAYDAADRLTNITSTGGKWLAFTYDVAGRRASSLDQLGHRLTYAYDTAGRLDSMTNELAQLVVRYEYDAAGRLTRKTLGNGMVATYGYDAAGQLLTLTNRLANGTAISWFNYTYDTRGRRTIMATHYGAWAYDYDDLGQLTRAALSSTDPQITSQDLAYVYDARGNRIRTIDNGVTTEYTANNLNQYVRVGSTNYLFDLDGNLVQEITSQGTNTFAYNDENRLIAVIQGADTWQYAYDALGNRVTTTENGVAKRFVIDPIGLGNVVGEYDTTANVLALYDHGLGLLSRRDAGANPAYYTFDAIGNSQQLVTAAGAFANAYAYAPFGAPLKRTETLPNPFQFVGQFGVMKEGNGLNLMRARYFSPHFGRFLQDDPLGLVAGMNLYTYGGNAPIAYIDPLGLRLDLARYIFVHGNWYGKYNSGGNRNTPIGSIGGLNVGWVDLADRGAKIHDILVYMGMPGAAAKVSDWFDRRIRDIVSAGGDLGDTEEEMIDWFQIGAALNILDDNLTAGRWRTFSDSDMKRLLDALREAIGSGDPLFEEISQVAKVTDPNQKTGPAGFGTNAFITPSSTLAYRVDFENATNALAPAQQVVITDQLSASLDWSAFRLAELGFGDQLIIVPPNSQHFETNVPVSYLGTNFEVQIEAGLNLANGQMSVIFRSIDPATSLPPPVNIGFLPPENGTGRGRGHVSYTITARTNLPTGTQIRNVAQISFDLLPSIATDLVDPHNPASGHDPAKQCLNTIDAGAPTSYVLALPATTNPKNFTVQWTGQDEASGSGVAAWDIYASTNATSWWLWLGHTTNTAGMFMGADGLTYYFYSVAQDNAGNVESKPPAPEAQTRVQLCSFVIVPTNAVVAARGGTNTVAVNEQGNCAWTVVNTNAWIRILSGGGTNSGAVKYSVAANTNVALRSGSMIIGGQMFTVTQKGTDTSLPSVAITSPTPNQRWTNGVFVARGTARDNKLVTDVWYQLNSGVWTEAATTNRWTNWTATVALTPGTNVVRACAWDTSGNASPTNTVRFSYVVTSPLHLQIVGNGKVSGATNGQLLEIGRDYKLTNSPAAGCVLTNWSGDVTGRGTTLTFTMKSNLTVVATFVDVTKPTLTVKAPTANQQSSNAVFTIQGTASDNVAVQQVQYNLNNSGWQLADGTTNWSKQVLLAKGTNILQAFAVDTTGNRSATNTVRFIYNQFLALAGTYNGLFYPTNELGPTNCGSMTLTLGSTVQGGFSGKLLLPATNLSFSSSFNSDLQAAPVNVPRGGKPPLAMTLQLNPIWQDPETQLAHSNVVTGTVADGTNWVSDLVAFRAFSGKTNAYAGNYTLLIGGSDTPAESPPGDGAGSVAVSGAGAVQVKGKLADNTPFTYSTTLSPDGLWPMFASLYGGRGLFVEWMACDTNQAGVVSTNFWLKPALVPKDPINTNGFAVRSLALLSKYTPAAAGHSAVNWTNGRVVLKFGNLPQPVTNDVVVSNNLVRVVGGTISNLTIGITNKDGTFGGSFKHPVSQAAVKFSGVLVPAAAGNNAYGGGWFVGPTEGGWVRLEPAQ